MSEAQRQQKKKLVVKDNLLNAGLNGVHIFLHFFTEAAVKIAELSKHT